MEMLLPPTTTRAAPPADGITATLARLPLAPLMASAICDPSGDQLRGRVRLVLTGSALESDKSAFALQSCERPAAGAHQKIRFPSGENCAPAWLAPFGEMKVAWGIAGAAWFE
jgi:hypothetical protein